MCRIKIHAQLIYDIKKVVRVYRFKMSAIISVDAIITLTLMTRVVVVFTDVLGNHILRKATQQENSVAKLKPLKGLTPNFLHPEESKDSITNLVRTKIRNSKSLESRDYAIFLTSAQHYSIATRVGDKDKQTLIEERLLELGEILGSPRLHIIFPADIRKLNYEHLLAKLEEKGIKCFILPFDKCALIRSTYNSLTRADNRGYTLTLIHQFITFNHMNHLKRTGMCNEGINHYWLFNLFHNLYALANRIDSQMAIKYLSTEPPNYELMETVDDFTLFAIEWKETSLYEMKDRTKHIVDLLLDPYPFGVGKSPRIHISNSDSDFMDWTITVVPDVNELPDYVDE
jgi:hypothetical protein